MVKALIVDDDPDIQEVVSLCFELQWPELSIVVAPDGRSGIEAFERENPDIIILDLGLPDMDGFQVCERIRAQSPVAILILSVRDREADIVRGLNAGADDYVTKPFSEIQLLARVQALLRRSRKNDSGDIFHGGGLQVDFAKREVTLNGEVLKLTPIEYKLLSLLVQNSDKLMTHSQLLEKVWGPEYMDATEYLKSHIKHLRRKLGDTPDNLSMIVNERGVGYRFVVPEAEAAVRRDPA